MKTFGRIICLSMLAKWSIKISEWNKNSLSNILLKCKITDRKIFQDERRPLNVAGNNEILNYYDDLWIGAQSRRLHCSQLLFHQKNFYYKLSYSINNQ